MSLVSQRYTLTQAPNTSCNEHSHGKAGEYIQNILLNIADPSRMRLSSHACIVKHLPDPRYIHANLTEDTLINNGDVKTLLYQFMSPSSVTYMTNLVLIFFRWWSVLRTHQIGGKVACQRFLIWLAKILCLHFRSSFLHESILWLINVSFQQLKRGCL